MGKRVERGGRVPRRKIGRKERGAEKKEGRRGEERKRDREGREERKREREEREERKSAEIKKKSFSPS